MVVDTLLLSFSVWMSFWLGLAHPMSPQVVAVGSWLVPAALVLGLPLYVLTGQYKGLSRYVGSRALYDLSGRTAVLTLLLVAVGSLLRWPMPPRSSWVLFWILLTGFSGAARFVLRDLLRGWQRAQEGQVINTVIYGAGAEGAQLARSLQFDHQQALLAFVDDDPRLWGRSLAGVDVISPQELSGLEADRVLLAMPSLKRAERRRIVDQLQDLGVPVLQVPSIEEITSGRARIDSLRPVAIEELLGRDPVPPNPELLGPGIRGKTVLVSGAGGSIGSELCRQVTRFAPAKLLLVERSEPALFHIDRELREVAPVGSGLVPLLADVGDEHRMRGIFEEHRPQVVFHAAAHKHVPLMEQQPGEALVNNSRKTLDLAKMAAHHGVGEFVMISTDKAINPTNVMGASKRVAEIGLQLLQKENPTMKITSVRFGNVLGSSGSVIPTFRRQIAAGGPVTVTHPEVTRYFMSVAEAVGLVLSAGRLGKGGEIFVLDMGEPVKIEAMARQLIELSGFEPGREIEIRYTGLRPGEKLYEELSHKEEVTEKTDHPKIWRLKPQNGPKFSLKSLELSIQGVIEEAAKGNTAGAKQKIKELVPEYTPWLG